jgi:tetratricopeptide (TPR) repeat protein
VNPLAPALEALGRGDARGATLLLKHLLVREPGHGEAWLTLAAPLVAQGQPKPALRLAERAFAIDPCSPLIQKNLIALANMDDDKNLALRLVSRAIEWSDDPDFRLHRADIAIAVGRTDIASRDYRHVLAARPGHLAASINLAAIQSAAGAPADAALLLRRTLALAPASDAAWNNLSYAALLLGNVAQTLMAVGIVANIDPQSITAQVNAAAALDLIDAAEVDGRLRRAIALGPQAVAALQALARRHSRAFRWAQFDTWIRRSLAVAPRDPETALAFAQGELIRGRMKTGWRSWEGRLARQSLARPDLPGRRWSGEPLDGSSLLIHAEQGFGETLQFLRFVSDVMRKATHVSVELPPELAELAARSFPGAAFLRREEPKPAHDWQCPLPSLAAALDVDLGSLAQAGSYLRASEAKTEYWRARFSSLPRPWIGFCWRGNPHFADDRRRSPGLARLPRLSRAAATLVSLTKMPTDLDSSLLGNIHDPGAAMATFDDTAALVAALDLVITSDTAIAHLAGGLGATTWLLLAHAADWRWLIDRTDSPWYASMRLFRQPRAADWDSVDAATTDALSRWMSDYRTASRL